MFGKKLGMVNLEGGLTGLGKITAIGLPSIISGTYD